MVVVGGYGVALTMVVPRVPDAGESILAGSSRLDHGGKGSNQAVAAARLGARVSLVSSVGDDQYGADAFDLWRSEGVDASGVRRVAGEATMTGVILLEPGGANRIVVAPGALAGLSGDDAIAPYLPGAAICLVSLEVPAGFALSVLRRARAAGVTTVLNPAPAPGAEAMAALLPFADYLTPNTAEAREIAGPGAAAELALRIHLSCGSCVVVTDGENGAFLADEGAVQHVAAPFVAEVADTAGAGDSFNAAFALAVAEGRSPLDACRLGCAAGAYSVTAAAVIPGLPTREQISWPLPVQTGNDQTLNVDGRTR
jgi:ribokinase